MRPNGFPDNHYHGGKGTESVCHFCCNPTSSDGMFCNRKMLDGSTTNQYALDASGKQMGLQFSDGTGFWFNVDSNPGTDGAGNVIKSLLVSKFYSKIQMPEMRSLTKNSFVLTIPI